MKSLSVIIIFFFLLTCFPDNIFASSFNENDDFLDEFDSMYEETNAKTENVADPFYYWNITVFHFNDKLYFWCLKPVSQGYKIVAPKLVRTGIKNFFINLKTPIRFVNTILQGKFKSAGTELLRFTINSTVGILGFSDTATKYSWAKPPTEDLGQTLGHYRIGNGFYIIWPVLGPSTLRDSFGLLGDWFLDPVNYVKPTEASFAITGFKTINDTSLKIGDYESLKDAALDPYEAVRNAYLQLRDKKIKE